MLLRKLLKGITRDTEASNGNLLKIRHSTEAKSAGRANFYSQTANFEWQSIARNARYLAGWRSVSHDSRDTGAAGVRKISIRTTTPCGSWCSAAAKTKPEHHDEHALVHRITTPTLLAFTIFSSIFLRSCANKSRTTAPLSSLSLLFVIV